MEDDELIPLDQLLKSRDFRSVDELLGALPRQDRRNYLLMVQSRSTQAASPKYPRVILKSPDSKRIYAFTTDPKGNGYESLEAIFWNEEMERFDFKRVDFSVGRAKLSDSYEDTASCRSCHGQRPRPNWDSYPFWAGLLPFNRDDLHAGTVEEKWYRRIYDGIESKDRLRRLVLRPELRDGTFLARKDSTYRIFHEGDEKYPTPDDGPGVKFFDQLGELNFRKIARELQEHPRSGRFKYAAAAAVSSCADIASFLSPEARNASEQYHGMDLMKLKAGSLRERCGGSRPVSPRSTQPCAPSSGA